MSLMNDDERSEKSSIYSVFIVDGMGRWWWIVREREKKLYNNSGEPRWISNNHNYTINAG